MTVNHGVPGSSPGEGARRKPLKSSILEAFLFLMTFSINQLLKNLSQKKTIYLQKLCAFYREEPTLKDGYNQFNLRPKEGI